VVQYEVQINIVQGGREVTVHPDNTHLRLNLSLHSTAQHAVQCKMVVWQQCPRWCTRDSPQPQNLVVFSVWLTQAVTLSRSAWWQVCVCVLVHERQHRGQTMSQVIAAFRERFNKAPPRRATVLDWEKRAFALGSVKDRPRSGRKTARLEACSCYRFH